MTRPKMQTLQPRVANVRSTLRTLVAPPTAAAQSMIPRLRGQAGVDRRARWLARFPICQHCEIDGIVRPGQEVDHVIPLFQGGADDESNLQTLCKPCHVRKTALETGHIRANAYPEWLEPAIGHLTLVIGPPGAGKTRYVGEHAALGDVVIDLDMIRAELSRQPIYRADDATWLNTCIRERNRRLGKLCRYPGNAWFIATGITVQQQRWWEARLKPASVVVLDVPLHTCIERITHDERRPNQVKEGGIAAARRWWASRSMYPGGTVST